MLTGQVGVARLPDAHRRLDATQMVRAQVRPRQVSDTVVAFTDHGDKRSRRDDLAAVSRGQQASAAVHRQPAVGAVRPDADLAEVKRHPHPQRSGRRPRLSRDRPLKRDRCGSRAARPLERHDRAIACALLHRTMSRCGRPVDEHLQAGQGRRHRFRLRLPGRGRPLDVGEQEGDGAGGPRPGVHRPIIAHHQAVTAAQKSSA